MGLVRVLVTGGTFDKVYNPVSESLEFTETHVPEMLRVGRVAADVKVEVLMLIDSLHMTGQDRENIRKRCLASIEDRLVITHGTGTMLETAALLGRDEGLARKTMVLAGAALPYSVAESDALFNFAGAYYAALCLAPGVYITMNWLVLPWNNAGKNAEKCSFEAANPFAKQT
ncbi:asparaginase [Candidatus Woesearchaeota archaeon]|nr:asparaginase [Candidatus Woesearchaeota archaeon]